MHNFILTAILETLTGLLMPPWLQAYAQAFLIVWICPAKLYTFQKTETTQAVQLGALGSYLKLSPSSWCFIRSWVNPTLPLVVLTHRVPIQLNVFPFYEGGEKKNFVEHYRTIKHTRSFSNFPVIRTNLPCQWLYRWGQKQICTCNDQTTQTQQHT